LFELLEKWPQSRNLGTDIQARAAGVRAPQRLILYGAVLTIRSEQLEAIGLARTREFERRAAGHVREYFSESYHAMGEEEVLASVRKALSKGREYGFDSEYDVVRYLNLMYALGFDFDRDIRYPWAGEILTDPQLGGHTKVDALMQMAGA
jgi:hypothetical protein